MSILDPSLTYGLPATLTAATGMDAFSHCVEALFCDQFSPVVDVLVESRLRLVVHNIVAAVGDGSNRTEGMLLGALYAGVGFQKGLGAVHALSHPLGIIGAHHGTINGILMPSVLSFNEVAARKAARRIGKLLGTDDSSAWIAALVRELGLPTRLRDVGLMRNDIPGMARKALAEYCLGTNPRTMSYDDAVSIYEMAW